MTDDWPFADPPNVAAITVQSVIEGAPILLVTHDADDGGWQFHTGGDANEDDGRVVSLASIFASDPSIGELADLPLGWRAWREAPGEPWTRVRPERGPKAAAQDVRLGTRGEVLAFKCRTCNEWHEGPIESLGADEPDQLRHVPDSEREERVALSSDQCILDMDGRHYFVRGCLEIPVIDGAGPFSFGVWTSLSEENFERANDLWETPGRESEEPYFGWLCTGLPGYPDTLFLKTWVQTRPLGERPLVTVFEPTDHPLFDEQRDGVTIDRLVEIIEAAMH